MAGPLRRLSLSRADRPRSISALAIMCLSKMTLTSFFVVLYYVPRGSVLMLNNQEPVLHTCCFSKGIMAPNA